MASNRESNLQRLQELARLDAPSPKDPAKYAGDLAQPLRKDQVPGELAKRWEALYEWHGVALGDRDSLLLKLVETHVPGFRRARQGRPPTRQRARALAEALEKASSDNAQRSRPSKRGAGRPRALSPESAQELVSGADAWKARQASAGKRRASDRGYVLHLCREHARRNRIRESRVVTEFAAAWTQRLYHARRRLSKS